MAPFARLKNSFLSKRLQLEGGHHMGLHRCVRARHPALLILAVMLSDPVNAGTGSAAITSSIEQLVGSWRLVSRVTTAADGRVLLDPGLSGTPSAVLIYDHSGHVAGQGARPGRTVEVLGAECRAVEKVKETSNNSQALLGYDAYFGTYTVDAKKGIVTHHLESALFPGDIGKDLKRNFSISGDTLTIKFQTTTPEGRPVVKTLVWTRMK
jgi:Lipocalin-like domain